MKLRVVNEAEFKTVIEDNEIVLVDFFAEWCGPCKMLAPVLEQIAAEYPKVKIVKVDVDLEQELTQSFGIQSVPTVIFFYNSEIKQKFTGFTPKARFVALLDAIV